MNTQQYNKLLTSYNGLLKEHDELPVKIFAGLIPEEYGNAYLKRLNREIDNLSNTMEYYKHRTINES